MCSDFTQSQNVRRPISDNQQKSPMVVNTKDGASLGLSNDVSPNVASYGSVASTHATQQHHECSIMPNRKADIDTSDIYPTLNFNVSTKPRLLLFVNY